MWTRFSSTLIACAVLIVLFSGCATKYTMPLDATPPSLDVNKNSIVLFTLHTANKIAESYEPEVKFVTIENVKGFKKKYKVIRSYDFQENLYYSFLISADLPPGEYRITEVQGIGRSTLILGQFKFNIHLHFTVPENSIVYLGRIEMINRTRKDGEPRSGGVLPLIDQAASGFAGGTFDVNILDASEKDLSFIKKKYPQLKAQELKVILARK